MTVLQVGSELQELGYRLIADLGAGLIGRRWKVQPIDLPPDGSISSRVAESVTVEDPATESLCDNIAMLVGSTEIRGVANVIAAHWSDDKTFVALIDLDPAARNVPSVMNADHFWNRAATMFNAIKQLHAQEIVHSAICREVVYVENEDYILGDLWWAHDAEGKPLHESFRDHYRESLPRGAWAFMAPEIISGVQPSRQSDLYSLGALWFYLLSGQLPRVVPEKGALSKIKKQLLEAPQPDLLNVHPEFDPEIATVVREMMRPDPADRMQIFQLEAALEAKASVPVGRQIISRQPFELTNELQIGISLVPPELPLRVLDIYSYGGDVQVGLDQGGQDLWLSLEGIIAMDGDVYLALGYQGDAYERVEIEPIVAVKMDGDHVVTLTADEFAAVRYELHISVQKRNAHNRDHVEAILGELREWND